MVVRGGWRGWLLVCGLVLGLSAASSRAQDTGTISATVIDSQGGAVPGATNTLQFRNVDRGARFDAAGNQTNINFGKANTARNPRIMQASFRFTF